MAPAMAPGAQNKVLQVCPRCGFLMEFDSKSCDNPRCGSGDIKAVLVTFSPQRKKS